MSLRPAQAVWFELLTTHDELTDTLQALAHTGTIELELYENTRQEMDLQDLQARLHEFARLKRKYHFLWPAPDTGMSPFSGSPGDILDKALVCLTDWEKQARPKIQRLEVVKSRLMDLRLLQDFLTNNEASALDFQLLSTTGPNIVARLFLLPSRRRMEKVPATVLWKEYATTERSYALFVGSIDELNQLSAELAIKKYTQIQIPVMPARIDDARLAISEKLSRLEIHARQLQKEIHDLAVPYHLAQALGEINRMEWFLANVSELPASINFAWITGWTSDVEGQKLRDAIELNSSHAILHFPDSPEGIQPPMMMRNPWWAKPFELFARMLGTPGSNEADPSRILAVMAPLLFGYMFGDVGQGLVLLIAGLILQKRWPLLRILVVNGASAMLFGFLFGSMFGREDLIPALWVHPIDDPLPVLAVPLVAGIVIILTGMTLNALESSWRGEWLRWLHVDAPVVGLYLGVISSFFLEGTISVVIIASALTWYLIGNMLLAGGKLMPVLTSLASLIEVMMQLVLNTVSFVRVGAFALAHAGLSLAFNIMADSAASALLAMLILLLGNIIVIVLEGLVVSIQTTRLILFEFFIRFLKADGRVFKPLSSPITRTISL
jgi:V/A-type H+-transporting ATPase subunit I